jgi:hypothetical protein
MGLDIFRAIFSQNHPVTLFVLATAWGKSHGNRKIFHFRRLLFSSSFFTPDYSVHINSDTMASLFLLGSVVPYFSAGIGSTTWFSLYSLVDPVLSLYK